MGRMEKMGYARVLAAALVAVGMAASCAVADQVTDTAVSPPTPNLNDLPLRESVSERGITWTFDKPARVGRFITGGWYVVGPVAVKAIDPKPLIGKEVVGSDKWTAVPKTDDEGKAIKNDKGKYIYEFTDIDNKERQAFGGDNPRLSKKEQAALKANPAYCRNGSVLNVPPELRKSGFDSRCRHDIYDAALTAQLPIRMKPGDALVSTISKKNLKRGKHYSTTAVVAVLTCLSEPAGADAFRPGYTDPEKTVYLARNLKRELLPTLERVKSTPEIAKLVKVFDRPWLEYNLFHEDHAPYQMGGYGQGLARRGGDTALILCLDFKPEEKEPLLIGYVQLGIDLYGMLKRGYTGWQAYGGWNSGHKHPIILAGLLLGDAKMASPSKTFPKVSFQEDEQTAYGRTWRGAPVVFQGHSGVDAATGLGRKRGRNDWGPYEHTHPSKWHAKNWQSDSYRRCCTSRTWPGTALAARLMKLEKYWAHDAFFDYVDRWMTEDETEALKVMADVPGGRKFDEWAWQGHVEVLFHEEMWRKYRPTLKPAPDAWRQKKPVDSVPEYGN